MGGVSFYPPPPTQQGTEAGGFEVGLSPLGSIPAFNWRATVISQYANSPVLLAMIESFNEAVDQTQNLNNFYDLIWNIDTAQGYGLDVWGRIVGVVRTLQISTSTYFGFRQGVPGTDVFGTGGTSPFFSGQPTTSNYSLTDDAFRQLILAKAAANICNGSIPALNGILMNLFGMSGTCYVTDGQDMTMTYTFKFQPTPVQAAIIEQSGVLPKPNGVTVSIVIDP